MADVKPSLGEHVVVYPPGSPVQAAVFLGKLPALARDDGRIELGAPNATREVDAHPDAAILCSTLLGARLLTGGDDGRVVAVSGDGSVEVLHDAKGKWIDALAGRADGAIAWSVGKTVTARDPKGGAKQATFASTARGLAFAPKGYRIAIAHYNGASLWFPNSEAPPEPYEWKGSHLSVTFSPDARFLVTAMQENALHGWRLSDSANMRMSGYPSKVRSLAWSPDGDWLATSGADSCVLWPFRDKDGPMKKPPLEVAVRKAKISKVAFHPKSPLLAVGYEDGWVLLCRIADNTELLVRRPDDARDPVTALAWSADGDHLLFGTGGGEAGLLSLPAALNPRLDDDREGVILFRLRCARTDAMILRRLALFVALLFGFLATQVPEFMQQYRQRLGGAIDELAAVVSRFESDSAQQGLTQTGGIDRLRSNSDRFVRERGNQEQDNLIRLQNLREAQAQLRSDGPVSQYATLLTHFDGRLAQGAIGDFSPAVPTTPQGFVFGLIGFVFGGGVVHIAGRPLRRRLRPERDMTRTA